MELKCKLNSSQMLHWKTSARFVRERLSAITALLRQKWLLIFSSYILWYIVAHPRCPNLSQNYFTGKLNTAPEVRGAWFLNALHPICLLREMWDTTCSECTNSACFVPGLCLLQYSSRSGSLVVVVWDELFWTACRISRRLLEQSHSVWSSAQHVLLPD